MAGSLDTTRPLVLRPPNYARVGVVIHSFGPPVRGPKAGLPVSDMHLMGQASSHDYGNIILHQCICSCRASYASCCCVAGHGLHRPELLLQVDGLREGHFDRARRQQENFAAPEPVTRP